MLRFVIVTTTVLLIACGQPKTESAIQSVDSSINTNINSILLNTNYNTSQLQGIYTGQFDGSPISIAINYVSGKNVSGYNVHKGLKRNVHGTLEPMGSQFKLMLDEPGDNKYDGHFDLFIDTASYTGQGTWTPRNDSTLKKKTFAITRQKSDFNLLANVWSDTAQNRNINIKEDGSAIFSYYVSAGTPQEQLETINGNWQQKKDSLLIFWQPNSVFSNRRSAFYIVKEHFNDSDTSIYVSSLRGESTEWTGIEF